MPGYLQKYILCLLLLLVIVAAGNLYVDPDGRFRVIDRPGFNQIKINPSPGSRQGKAVALQQCDYGTVILGSSRAETGMNPNSSEFDALPVYNAALIGTSMREILSMAEFVVSNQRPETIVFGIDFLTFNIRRTYEVDYLDSILYNNPSLLSILKYALSMDTLIASWFTVSWNTAGIARRCNDNGHNDKSRTLVDHREAFDEIQYTYIRNPSLYGNYVLNQDYLDKFERLIRLIVTADIDLRLFISPMHAVHMELLDDSDLIPAFEDWKRQLVRVVAEINAAEDLREPLQLVDFSGYNSVTTESVPAAGSDLQMQYYRDPAHYRIGTGDMILRRLLHPAEARTTLPDDFGIVLTPENIENSFKQSRRRAKVYRDSAPDEVRNTRRIAAEARSNPR